MDSVSKLVRCVRACTRGLPTVLSTSFPVYQKHMACLLALRSPMRQHHVQRRALTSISNESNITKSIPDLTKSPSISNSKTTTNTENRDKIFKNISKPLMTSHSTKLPIKTDVYFSTRQMKREDLPCIYEMLDEQGWIMEKAYLECAFDTDPSGFVVAETAEGEVIGSHGFLSHDGKVASMGLWMVKKSHRNSNIGLKLYEELAKRLQ